MAGRGLGTLTLDLVTRIGGFTGPLDKAGRELDKRMGAMEKRAVQAGKAIGVALVAAATAAGYAIKGAIDRADELSKGAQKIGVTTEALSRLAYAADLSDVSIEQLQTGLAKLTKFQASAAQGNKEAIRTFEAFNIAIKDGAGNLRGTEAVLQDFAKVFAALPDGPEKTALALRVFGKSGAELIPLLNEGADGLARMAAEADNLGITISTQTGKQAEEFNDNITRLKAGLTGLATDVAGKLLPALIDLTELLRDLKSEKAGSAIGEELAFGLDYATKSIRRTSFELQELKKAWNEQGLFGEGIFSVLSRAQRMAEEAGARSAALGATRPALGNPGNAAGRGVASARAAGQADAEAAKAAEAARKLIATTNDSTSASKANAEAKRAATEAAREQAEREKELEEAVRKAADAQAEFNRQMEDLVAQQGGPLAESQLRYRREEEELRKLWAEGSTPAAEDLTTALQALHAERDKDAESIRKSLDTGEQHLEQLRNELELLQLTSQAERDRAAFLLDNPTATGAQADQAAAISRQIDETRKAIQAADDVRLAFEDAFVNVFTDGISAVDQFFAAIQRQLLMLTAQKVSSAIFGEAGTSGWLGALFGGGSSPAAATGPTGFLSAFGGSYANGTDFAPGGMSLVGERGPEIVNLPRGASVTPNHKLGGTTIHVNVQPTTDRRAAQQIANEVSRKLAFSTRGGR